MHEVESASNKNNIIQKKSSLRRWLLLSAGFVAIELNYSVSAGHRQALSRFLTQTG